MISISQNDCIYLTPNKTVEEILITKLENKKIVYVYNYKGVSFRVFSSKDHLEKFFNNFQEETVHFTSEEDLDRYLWQIVF